jgi:hypothetical protein
VTPTSQQTTAEDKGDHYLLNGTKNWITNGNSASTYLVIAQTDVAKGSRGINAFIVEKNWPGVVVGAKENKLGIRGSDTHSILFNDVKVPKENRIGEDGFGFTFAMKTLAADALALHRRHWALPVVPTNDHWPIASSARLLAKRSCTTRSYNLNWQIWLPGLNVPDCFAEGCMGKRCRIRLYR